MAETSSRACLTVSHGMSVGCAKNARLDEKGCGKEVQTRSTLTISAWIFRPLGAS